MPNCEKLRFAVFGRIIHTDFFIRELHARGFPAPLVIVSPDDEYLRDERLLKPFGLWSDLEALSKTGLAELYKLETINSKEAFMLLREHKCNIGISINCRTIIKREIIDYFDGNIFNLHDSYLPDERGGALNTWRILNGINTVGNTIHYLDEGIDSGPIVVQRRVAIQKEYPKAIDYLLAEVGNCQVLLRQFLDLVLQDSRVPSFPQDNDKSFYFPRLYTELNGVVDWNWDVEFVERFIRAFGSPYPGAHTYYREKKLHILDGYIDAAIPLKFHPFGNGKIITVLNNQDVRVIAGGRACILTEISVDDKVMKPGQYLSVKYTMYSKNEELEQSRNYLPTTREMNKLEKV